MKILYSSYEIELIAGGGRRCFGVSFGKNGATATYLTGSFADGYSCSKHYCDNGYDFVKLGAEQVWCKDKQRELTNIQLYNAKRALETISTNVCSKVFCGENGIFTNGYVE